MRHLIMDILQLRQSNQWEETGGGSVGENPLKLLLLVSPVTIHRNEITHYSL